jgi:hypothetical protein
VLTASREVENAEWRQYLKLTKSGRPFMSYKATVEGQEIKYSKFESMVHVASAVNGCITRTGAAYGAEDDALAF